MPNSWSMAVDIFWQVRFRAFRKISIVCKRRQIAWLLTLAVFMTALFPHPVAGSTALAEGEAWVSSLNIQGSTLYAAYNDGTVRAFHLPDGKPLAEYHHATYETPMGPAVSSAYWAVASADGRWTLSAASSGSLTLLDGNLKPVKSIQLPSVHSYSAAFAGAGMALVSSITGHVMALDIPGLEALWKVKANWDSVKSLAVDMAGGRFVTASNDSRLHLRRLDGGALIKTLSGHKDAIYTVSFSPDGKRILSGSKDQRLLYWDVEAGTATELLRDSAYIQAAGIIAGGAFAVCASGTKDIALVSLSTFARVATLKGHTMAVTAFAYRDGTLYSGSTDGAVRRWDIGPYMKINRNKNGG